MAVKFSNNASALLDGAITNSATSITLDDVSEFPVLAGGDYTYVTLANAAATKIEIIKVTAINTGTKVLTVVRAQDSTSAAAFDDGDICELRITAALLTAHVEALVSAENTLAEDDDVNLTSPGDGALLIYDTGTSTWRDAAMSGDATISDTGVITIGDDKIDSQHYAVASIDAEHLATDSVIGQAAIVDNSVIEEKLGISNAGTNGQYLQKQSGNTGGLTWATPTDTDTTYTAGTGITLSGTEFSAAPLALTTVQTAANQTAHLALTAQEGDIVVRSDENKTYCHNGGSAGTMADFTLLATPTDAVLSVNGQTGAITAAHIKTAYEANSDTNEFSDAEQTKLAGIAASANAYTHPTSAGNKHIPSGGSTGQILKYSSAGTVTWETLDDAVAMAIALG